MTSLDIGRVRRAFPGRHIEYLESVDSTMRVAAALEPGSIVLAEEQTAGQGRHGRTWHSEPGAGIYCSMVLLGRPPALPTAPEPSRTLALALAARASIAQVAGIECDIRWPNDLLLGGKKVAGILVQASGGRAVVGIGINVHHAAFPLDLAESATSLRLAAPAVWRPELREEILLALIPAVDEHVNMETGAVLSLFSAASSYVSGRRVRVDQPEGVLEGVTAGLDSSGFLKVRKQDGSETLVLAGGVRAAGA